MKRFFVCSVSFFFFLAAAVLADVTMRDIWHWGLVRKSDILPLATTQHVAEAVGPLATTQHVAEALAPYATTQQVAEAVSGVTAEQIGALTNEQDLAALRAWHYGSPEVVESPAGWFEFDASTGAITGFNYAPGRENVVVPWEIGGVAVVRLGGYSFLDQTAIKQVYVPRTVGQIDECAFYGSSDNLTVTNVVFCGDAPSIDHNAFNSINEGVVITVLNSNAKGWPETLEQYYRPIPVVRPPLYAEAIYQAGELVATTGHVAQAIASQLPGIVYSNSVSALTIYTNASGAATSWWQVASGVTNSGTFSQGTPGAITNELDLVALAADRFLPIDAGKNVISTDAGSGSIVTYSTLIGDRAGNSITGANVIAIGRDAARDILNPGVITPETDLSTIAIGENAAEQAGGMGAFSYNIAIGNSAFKEGAGQSSIAIGQDALDKTPGAFTTIAIGREAGRTAAAEHMIAIGYQAGEQAGLTNSVVIGANAGRRASGQNILVIDSSGNDDSSYPERAMIYGNANDLTLGRIDSDNNLRGNWLFNNNQILTNEVDPVAGPRLDLIEPETNKWNAAYGWGDHALAGYLLPAALAPLATTQQVEAAAAALAAHTTRKDNPHGVTAAQVGALTAEQDLAALRAYHYGSPDIVESPAGWFEFDGAGTITAFNWASVTNWNIVIPWQIGGVPVTTIRNSAFGMSGIMSVIAPQTVTVIGDNAFYACGSLTSVSLPQATAVGDYAFFYCTSLTSVTIPQATSIGNNAFSYCDSLSSVSLPQATAISDYAFYACTSLASVHMGQNAPAEATEVFYGITLPPTVYVTNPQATGWGDIWNGAPVVRPPLYADAIYQEGALVATTQYVAQAIAAIPEPDLSDRPTFAQIAASNALPYTAWTGTVTPQNGTATVAYAHGNMPVLVTDAPCVLTLDPTGYGTAGVSRVSLSYYTGTNSFTFATNVITYSATPNVDTNGWNTLLIRRVSDGAWKGVGL